MKDEIAEAVVEGKDGVVIRVEVSPGSKDVSFGYNKWRKALEVRLKNPARAGKANRELLEILGKIFGEIEILSGEKSRLKNVRVGGSKEEVVEKLVQLIGKSVNQ